MDRLISLTTGSSGGLSASQNWEFLKQLNDYQLLNKDSVKCNYVLPSRIYLSCQ
jgi:hypothetical protein